MEVKIKKIENVSTPSDVLETIYDKGFIESGMINIGSALDNFLINQLNKATIKIGIDINEDKLREWITLCTNLENIDRSELIDIAEQRKFYQLQKQVSTLNKALEYACDELETARDMLLSIGEQDKARTLYTSIDYFIKKGGLDKTNDK